MIISEQSESGGGGSYQIRSGRVTDECAVPFDELQQHVSALRAHEHGQGPQPGLGHRLLVDGHHVIAASVPSHLVFPPAHLQVPAVEASLVIHFTRRNRNLEQQHTHAWSL